MTPGLRERAHLALFFIFFGVVASTGDAGISPHWHYRKILNVTATAVNPNERENDETTYTHFVTKQVVQ